MTARAVLWVALLGTVAALKEHDFRKCRDTPFCKSHRAAASHAWTVNASAVAFAKGVLSARLVPPSEPSLAHLLPTLLRMSVLPTGTVRIRVDEDPHLTDEELQVADPAVPKPAEWDDDMDGEWDAPMLKRGRAVKRRFEPTHALASPAAAAPTEACEHDASSYHRVDFLRCRVGSTLVEVRLVHSPLVIAVHTGTGKEVDAEPVALLNANGKLRFEPFRASGPSETAEAAEAAPAHTFNSFTLKQPFGDSSVGLDVSFPGATHAYGLPERTVAHALPNTLGAEPYRLYNLASPTPFSHLPSPSPSLHRLLTPSIAFHQVQPRRVRVPSRPSDGTLRLNPHAARSRRGRRARRAVAQPLGDLRRPRLPRRRRRRRRRRHGQ